MSDYFNSLINRIVAGSLAKSEQVNNLRDETGVGFDLLPSVSNLTKNKTTYAADTGAADAYAVALPTTQTAYVAGLQVDFIPANANTGASTINVDGLGVRSIKSPAGNDLVAGDLSTTTPVTLRYNGSEFRFTGASPLSSFINADADAAAAAASAAAAAISETNAGNSETAAGVSETNAAASAAAAAVSAASITDIIQTSPTDNTAGHLLTVGAFGLGANTPTTATDLDDLTVTGVWRFNGGTANKPSSAFGEVLHLQYAPAYSSQVATEFGTGDVYTRAENNSVWSAWSQIYDQKSILGTVSESSGVPTGKIIERGSNANGEYIKFADGTLICTEILESSTACNIASGSLFRTGSNTWTFPAAFVSVPSVSMSPTSVVPFSWGCSVAGVATSTTAVGWCGMSSVTDAGSPFMSLTAIGRWF